MKIIKYILPSLMFFSSCSSETEQVKNKTTATPIKVDPKDFYTFKHLLPESDYFYNIEITEIDFKTHKDAFSITKDKYDVPSKLDGLTLNIKFKMSNPYSKVMQIPFTDYFYVTSKEFDELEKFSFSKSCWCNSDGTSNIKNEKGKELSEFTKRGEGSFSSNHIIEFKPNETQEFTVSFDEPFPVTVKSITFVGFNQRLYKQVDFSVYEKMSEAERKETEAKSHAIVINVASKKITDRTIMKP